jgi:hypothetical protein
MNIEKWRATALEKFAHWSNWNDSEIVMSGHMAAKAYDLSISNESSVVFHASGPRSKDFRGFLQEMKLRVSETPSDGISVIFSSNRFPVREVRRFSQDGGFIADPIQVFLDVQYTGARGREQADFIFERFLEPHFRRNQCQK